ncbi:exodeoxyribonuclease 7 large subunit [Firmicutes bacterium CAG:822]|nr:exodeoxyribonuclease 7 large subunit [Firmicutes bacterium CAG:822]
MNEKYLTVSAVTRYLKAKFDIDENLQTVYLKGEISNFKAHTSGHFYFSLKDENSKINAIMFRSNASKVIFKPADGMKVLVTGRISVYEAMGSYQIYVDEMLEDGVGNLYIAFEQLKKKLQAEGLFDEAHKKPIPRIPKRVGIVTASTGAAIRDIMTTIKRRFPICETILFPTLVQGENAKDDIVRNIKRAEDYDLDVLIVGRGGGSIEDLWPFNEEIVARAIYDCRIPVISAVGHEVDFTIADFVADLRAPTPTAAAELAVPNMSDLKKHIDQLSIRLNEAIYKKVNYLKLYLDSVKNSFVIKNPGVMFENRKQSLDLMNTKLNELMLGKVDKMKNELEKIKKSYVLTNPKLLYKDNVVCLKNIIDKLELLNPLNILSRGYSITYMNDKALKSVKEVKKDDVLKIKLYDGMLETRVSKIEEDK